MTSIKQHADRLARLTLPELQREYEAVCREPARSNNRVFIAKRLLWRIQAEADGGLSERALSRADELSRGRGIRVRPGPEVRAAVEDALAGQRPTDDLRVGQILVRVYRGRRIEVRVVEGGFELDGVVHRSLSAAARAITGASWNGRLFFGLASRGGGS